MGRGEAVTLGQPAGQDGWQDQTEPGPENVQAWSTGYVRLLHAAGAIRQELPLREKDQTPFLPFLPAENQCRYQQTRGWELISASASRTLLPSAA